MATEDFCLKWNDHHSLFFTLAETLCKDGLLTDVTLATSSRTFSAHRLVLSVCSSFFKDLFARSEVSSSKNTFVYLKDVEPHHLDMLLSYMYRGEINVEETDLMDLLSTARGLGIKGLSEVNDLGSSSKAATNPTPSPQDKPRKKRPRSEEKNFVENYQKPPPILQPPPLKNEMDIMNIAAKNYDNYESLSAEDDSFEIVDPTLNQTVECDDGGWPVEEDDQVDEHYDSAFDINRPPPGGFEENLNCPECPKQFASSWHLRRHVQTHSKQKKYPCDLCGKFFSRADNLKSHQKSVHGLMFPPVPPKLGQQDTVPYL